VGLRERLPAAAPSPRARAALVALVTALVLLAGLVEAGAFTRLDQFSLDHLMPWLVPGNAKGSTVAGLYRPFAIPTPTAIKLLDLWTYPCSVLVSALVVIGASIVLWRRVGLPAALAPGVIWVVGNGIEVVSKGVIRRPALFGTTDGERVHVTPFDGSFTSGHMMRGVIVAWAIALVWRRAAPWAAAWALLVGPALVLQSAHTITDVVGGALLGLVLVVAVHPVVTSPVAVGTAG
jgi:membrane-associated phospholipid phosphatase